MTKDMAATFGKALVSTAAKQCALIVANQVVSCYRIAPPKSKSGDEYECVSSAPTKSGYDIYTISCSCFAKYCVRLVYNEGKTFIDSHYGETVRSDDGDDLYCIPSDRVAEGCSEIRMDAVTDSTSAQTLADTAANISVARRVSLLHVLRYHATVMATLWNKIFKYTE